MGSQASTSGPRDKLCTDFLPRDLLHDYLPPLDGVPGGEAGAVSLQDPAQGLLRCCRQRELGLQSFIQHGHLPGVKHCASPGPSRCLQSSGGGGGRDRQ